MSVASTLMMFLAMFVSESDRTQEQPDMDLNAQVSNTELPHEWMTSFDDAAKLAAKHKLPLLLHFDATWCGACRRMESEVLNKTDVTQMLGHSVIGVRIDADQYKHLISEYGISTLPTEVVVNPDGSRGDRFVGAVSLSAYVSRLKNLANSTATSVSTKETAVADGTEEEQSVRSCLIVRHDGKMVGVGGFSPVALVEGRRWVKGSDQFVATHEGVEYFLQSEAELIRFTASPQKYVPRLHGCDLVELHLENRATTGAIEYGAFYDGKVFFFASLENRSRFESNPTWYLGAMTDARTANDEMFPFLKPETAQN